LIAGIIGDFYSGLRWWSQHQVLSVIFHKLRLRSAHQWVKQQQMLTHINSLE